MNRFKRLLTWMIRLGAASVLCVPAMQAIAQSAPATPVTPTPSGPWDGFSLASREGDQWRVMFSPHTTHYTYSEEHKRVILLGAERERADGALAGVTFFSNSFGQPSTYIFPWGKVYRDVLGLDGAFVKWTAGLLYGYRSPYENKVPLNHDGYSPGFIPGIGWESSRLQLQLNFLGNAGVMYQLSWKISP